MGLRWDESGSPSRTALLVALLLTVSGAHAQAPSDNHVRTLSGLDLGAANYKDITEAESAVRFTDPADVKSRRAATLNDRTLELLVLRNNAVLVYSRVYLRRQDFGPRVPGKALADLPYQLNTDFLRSRGIHYDEHDAKQAGLLAYLVQSSATDTCFVFNAYVGDAVRFDQQIRGNVCYPVASRSPAQLEKAMLVLLSRARFASAMDHDSFTVSFEFSEAVILQPPAAQPGTLQAAPAPSTPAPAPSATPTPDPNPPRSDTAPRSPSPAAAARLQTLKDLLDQKLITPSEYEAKRKAIVDAL